MGDTPDRERPREGPEVAERPPSAAFLFGGATVRASGAPQLPYPGVCQTCVTPQAVIGARDELVRVRQRGERDLMGPLVFAAELQRIGEHAEHEHQLATLQLF